MGISSNDIVQNILESWAMNKLEQTLENIWSQAERLTAEAVAWEVFEEGKEPRRFSCDPS